MTPTQWTIQVQEALVRRPEGVAIRIDMSIPEDDFKKIEECATAQGKQAEELISDHLRNLSNEVASFDDLV